MRQSINKLVNICIAICITTFYILYTESCANTSGGPIGGPKDTIPPIVVKTIPDSLPTQFPINKGKIIITFNEYVQLKNPNTEIVVSPPSKKKPQTRLKGKGVIVSFKDTLREDQTYTIYFGNSITDVNEGNQLPNYTYTFSTGNQIDSLIISGTVMNYSTLFPIKGATILLYQNPKDSTVMKELPIAVAKSDDWGYFCIRGLKKQPYSLFAIEDKNGNYLYNKGIELAGFCDSTITPSTVAKEGIPQIAQYDMKDTIKCLSRPSEVDIYLFKETDDNQYIRSYGRISERECYVKFNTNNVVIDTFNIRGVFNDKIIKQFNEDGDSLTFWINEQRKIADTLLLRINYMKTDTTGKLAPHGETLKLAVPFDKSKIKDQNTTNNVRSYAESLGETGTNRNRRNPYNTNNQENNNEIKDNKEKKTRDDLLQFEIKVKGENVENKGIELLFKAPLLKILKDSIKFTSTNPRQITTEVKFDLIKDSTNVLKYNIRSREEYKQGFDYRVYIPTATFTDINGFTNDSTDTKFNLPSNDKLSSITLEIENSNNNKYIVELINEARDKVFFRYEIDSDKPLLFPYLQEASYSIRITEDINKNGKHDIGSILERKQPEKARLFKLADGGVIIHLKEQTDLTQTVDLQQLFK